MTTPERIDSTKNLPPAHENSSRSIALAILLAIAAMMLTAVPIAQSQAIWSDETTQMVGLRLGPADVTRWLMGEDPDRFGVPPDRMPPVSYWAGWAWSHIFGLTEGSLRGMSLFATACATAAVALAAGRLGGPKSAILAGFLFGLSPNVVGMAGEIRAYPLLLAASGFAYVALLGYVQSTAKTEGRWLLGLVGISVVASYIHFFGMVLGGAVLSSAFFMSVLQKRSPIRPLIASSGFLLLSAGIVPFVLYSVRLSGPTGTASARPSFLRTLYRLIGNPAASVDTPALAALVIGFVSLFALALLPRRQQDSATPERQRLRLDMLAVPLALFNGLFVVFLAGKLSKTFDAYSPSYNLWAVPGLCIAAGSALATGLGRKMANAGLAGGFLAVVGSLWADSVMILNRPTFGHALNGRIVAMMEPGPDGKLPIIVHDGESAYGPAYFPLRYTYEQNVIQYCLDKASGKSVLVPLAGTNEPASLSGLPAGRRVLVIHTTPFGYGELQHAVRGGIAIPTGHLIEDLDRSPEWTKINSLTLPAVIAAQARVYEKRADPAK